MYALRINAIFYFFFSTVLLVFGIRDIFPSSIGEKMLQERDFKFRNQAFG